MLDSQSVSMSIGEILPSKSVARALVTEPKVFPHELQQLDDTEAICVWRPESRVIKLDATPERIARAMFAAVKPPDPSPRGRGGDEP